MTEPELPKGFVKVPENLELTAEDKEKLEALARGDDNAENDNKTWNATGKE